ncbi:DUF4374 domain-containing protein [Chitinophaga alhagiae]|nr:DUF4374 domain-containing protein [Chitinophaga alhagiae]
MGTLWTACSKDEGQPGNGGEGGGQGKTKYIIASTPVASTGVADYLLTTDNITQGAISTQGNGKEQDGTYRYYITHRNRFFSLLYGQGNPGAVTTYNLNAGGELIKVSDFQSETVQVHTTMNDDIVTMKVPRSGNENALVFRIDAQKSQIAGEAQVNIVHLAGNGERAHFTWATQAGNKLFAPYMSIKGAAPDVFGTSFPDSCWVAVFSYPDLKLERVIRDNRTSYLGAYFTSGLVQTESGDLYGFSGSSATSNGTPTSTKPSAVVRIKKDATEFDKNYLFNLETASGGHRFANQTYFGNGKFLLEMYAEKGKTSGKVKFAVVDVTAQTFAWVTGTPADITSTSRLCNLVAGDDKTIYAGLTDAGGSYVYSFDATTAKATRGLKVEGGKITGIAKLTY